LPWRRENHPFDIRERISQTRLNAKSKQMRSQPERPPVAPVVSAPFQQCIPRAGIRSTRAAGACRLSSDGDSSMHRRVQGTVVTILHPVAKSIEEDTCLHPYAALLVRGNKRALFRGIHEFTCDRAVSDSILST